MHDIGADIRLKSIPTFPKKTHPTTNPLALNQSELIKRKISTEEEKLASRSLNQSNSNVSKHGKRNFNFSNLHVTTE